ncbi:MAG: helix-turn-helix domain-containing protein [Alphaproteobacteria bacterium]|nr:helix-turn-helix domain-containing protein [Alphaproteobacteria bacterium]
MRTIKDYISEAQKKQGIPSNNKLASALGITPSGVSVLYKGKSLPTDETMIKLAELAGIPEEEALVDLSIWRNADSPKTKEIWEKIRHIVLSLCLTMAVLSPFGSGSLAASGNTGK